MARRRHATWDQSTRRSSTAACRCSTVTAGQRAPSRTRKAGRAGPAARQRVGAGEGCDGELWVGTGNGWDFWGAGVDVLQTGASVHVRAQDRLDRSRVPEAGRQQHHRHRGRLRAAGRCGCRRSTTLRRATPTTGQRAGDYVGGGVAVYDVAAQRWTRYDATDGLECYSQSYIECEATEVEVGRDDPCGSARTA